jgi:hypothetical protein
MGNIKIKAIKSIAESVSEDRKELLFNFVEYCAKELRLKGDVSILLKGKAKLNGITTGAYNLIDKSICSRYEERAMVDVIRTIAHEMVHQSQDERGDLNGKTNIPDIGGPIEDEANAVAGQLIKKFVKEHDARFIYEL